VGADVGSVRLVSAPSGTVTFLFTDVEGSTRLWEEQPEAMRTALARHDVIVRSAVETYGGTIVKTTGDGAHAAFADAVDGVMAAMNAQRALGSETWPVEATISARMGIHTGVAEARDGDYYGPTLNRAARIMAIAHGGQILISDATSAVLRDERAITLRDLGEHRLRDLSRPERLYQVTADGLRDEFPPPRSLDALPTNLPSQLTTFIGRAAELVRVTKAIADYRLVTLTGVGGVGKTRLALQVAADVIAQFADGVWVCELAPATDAETLLGVVAATFSVPDRPGVALEQSVVEALRPRHLLWIVDNCEHLVEPTARLIDRVLRVCPGVRVLATSREALDLDGEATVPIRSMALAASDDTADVAQSDAARLFAERAAAARPGFTFDAATAASINEVCRRLDGIPLAIELAASRVASLGVAVILTLLDERFRLLTGGRRIALERHQTLRAAVDWSYSLLDDAERTVFARLAVFPGSFDTRAARDVVADEAIDEWAVLDALDGLVRKSMLALDDQPDTSVRYQLLETMRQYGRERLEEMGESDTVRRRHAEHFVLRCDEMGLGLMGPDELTSRAQLQLEVDNIRAVGAWALDVGEVRTVLRIIVALNEEQLLGVFPIGAIATPALVMLDELTAHERLEIIAAAVAEAWRHDIERIPELLALVGDDRPDPRSSNARVLRLFTTSGFTNIEESRVIAEAARDWDFDVTSVSGAMATERSHLANAFANAAINAGEALLARQYASVQVTLARRGGSPSAIGLAARTLGASISADEPEEARRLFQECIDLGRSGVPFAGISAALIHSALIDVQHGDGASAAVLLAEAIAVARARGRSPELDGACGYAIEILLALGDTEAALVLVGAVIDGELCGLRDMTMPPGRTRPDTRALRAQVGKERFGELLSTGAHMPYEDLLDHILTSLQTASQITS
jgi:predicted ATPase/class 3 adenylate cyclase